MNFQKQTSKHLDEAILEYFYGKVLFTCCVLRYVEIVHGMPNQQSMHSEKSGIPFAFDRSLLWGSMNYSLTQSGEQKTSSGADWPHAQISTCICGKRRGNIIPLLVLDTFIGEMLGNTSISWSYLTFHVAERCSAAIVTSYLQTFWCDDLEPCKKDHKKSACTSTDILCHLTFGVEKSLRKNVHLRRYTPNHCSIMRRKSALASRWDWSRKSPPNFDSEKLVSFFKGRCCLGFGVALFLLTSPLQVSQFWGGVWCNNIGWTWKHGWCYTTDALQSCG